MLHTLTLTQVNEGKEREVFFRSDCMNLPKFFCYLADSLYLCSEFE